MTDIPNGAAFDTSSGFSIGNIIERSFAVFGRNLVPFLVLGAICTSPYIFLYWGQAQMTLARPGDPTAAINAMKGFGRSAAISVGLGFFVATLGRAALISAVFQAMRGQPVEVLGSLRRGLARFFPVLGMSIVLGLGIFAASLLLIVPGIILYTMWYVALPACVVERQGPLASLRRSAQLTKGNRWKIFGMAFLVALVGGIISAVANGVFLAAHNRVAFTVGEYLTQTVVFAVGSIIALVLYHDLRVAKEGIDTDRIAAVFD